MQPHFTDKIHGSGLEIPSSQPASCREEGLEDRLIEVERPGIPFDRDGEGGL